MEFADAPELPSRIDSLESAIQFIAHLYLVDVISFHPDTRFFDRHGVGYVDRQGKPAYSVPEAKKRELLRREYWMAPIDQYNLPIWVGAWFKFYPEKDLDDVPPEVLEILEQGFRRKQDWSTRKPE